MSIRVTGAISNRFQTTERGGGACAGDEGAGGGRSLPAAGDPGAEGTIHKGRPQ